MSIGTSKTQSKRLLELGLKASSSDMYYPCYSSVPKGLDEFTFNDWYEYNEHKDIPCWSIGALIELLPIGTHICSHITDAGIVYECYTEEERFECLTILDAVFSMIEWLLKIHWLDNSQLQVR